MINALNKQISFHLKIISSFSRISRNFTGNIEIPDGTKKWLLNGLFHREDGPAVEHSNGDKFWFLKGKFHRINGPAIEWSDGSKDWYLNNEQSSEEEWKQKTQRTNK